MSNVSASNITATRVVQIDCVDDCFTLHPLKVGAEGAALVQFVPSEVNTFPEVQGDGTIATPQTVGIFVLSIFVNHPFVTRVAVAPIVVMNRFAHFFVVVPRSSVLSVSDTREVFIATEARLSSALVE